MKIKYTEMYGKLEIQMPEHNFFMGFERNVWKEIPDKMAKILLKNPCWISEEDCIFDVKKANEFYGKSVCFKRNYALGDLIQLIPVAKQFKKLFNCKIVLATRMEYLDFFKSIKVYDNVILSNSVIREDYFRIIYLDGVLEADHSLTNSEHLKHRIDIYSEFFKFEKYPLDFDIFIEPNTLEKVEKLLC